MICRKCGTNNHPEARFCSTCGAPMETPELGTNKTKNQTLIILTVVIVILALALAAVSITLVWSKSNSQTQGLDGGDSTPVPTFAAEETAPPAEPVGQTEEVTEEPTPMPQADSFNHEKSEKKDEFLAKAEGIELYEENSIETAMSQYEINRESGIVYEKWDALLNEVYQYLKTILPDDEFNRLQQDELDWIAEKERAIEKAGAEWAGGSG